jgi:hypothetical protein
MDNRKWFFLRGVLVAAVAVMGLAAQSGAMEVNKGAIPAEHLVKTCKTLPWGVEVWDIEEAVSRMNDNAALLWVDTRPESFFKQGSLRGAVLLPYDQTGGTGNDLTKDKLEAALKAKGLSKDTARVAFFCQGPTCHRSYNAAYVAAVQWGFNPKNIVWFRDGYPVLLKEVKDNPQLKRKAKLYLSDEAVAEM